MIKFENLTKHYPGVLTPAVDKLSFTVPTGEICTLVGPSGCGKTTSLKMVNRLIEPSSGAIYVPDEDGQLMNVMDVNPIQLRRRIGYVIQQIGLFPHRTIYENMTTVPKLLGWKEEKMRKRAEELLEMMNMPIEFLERYPHELSGGQRQRIGVARGMAVDPPIMLMDEPFGAIDPISRNLLQNEFLRLQKEIKKTILFVTHDIDEAIKMSDKICILNVGGHLEQFDSPANILSNPNNEFVEDFVGADRALKQLNLIRVEDIMYPNPLLLKLSDSAEYALGYMHEHEVSFTFVCDEEKHLKGYVVRKELRGKSGTVSDFYDKEENGIELSTTLRDTLSEMLMLNLPSVCIVDHKNRIHGLINMEMIQKTISESNGNGVDEDDEE